jgi:hypothetical protein
MRQDTFTLNMMLIRGLSKCNVKILNVVVVVDNINWLLLVYLIIMLSKDWIIIRKINFISHHLGLSQMKQVKILVISH